MTTEYFSIDVFKRQFYGPWLSWVCLRQQHGRPAGVIFDDGTPFPRMSVHNTGRYNVVIESVDLESTEKTHQLILSDDANSKKIDSRVSRDILILPNTKEVLRLKPNRFSPDQKKLKYHIILTLRCGPPEHQQTIKVPIGPLCVISITNTEKNFFKAINPRSHRHRTCEMVEMLLAMSVETKAGTRPTPPNRIESIPPNYGSIIAEINKQYTPDQINMALLKSLIDPNAASSVDAMAVPSSPITDGEDDVCSVTENDDEVLIPKRRKFAGSHGIGTNSNDSAGAFSASSTARMHTITPAFSHLDGYTVVVIHGKHFGDETQVSDISVEFGGFVSPKVVSVTPTSITCVTPAIQRPALVEVNVHIRSKQHKWTRAEGRVYFEFCAHDRFEFLFNSSAAAASSSSTADEASSSSDESNLMSVDDTPLPYCARPKQEEDRPAPRRKRARSCCSTSSSCCSTTPSRTNNTSAPHLPGSSSPSSTPSASAAATAVFSPLSREPGAGALDIFAAAIDIFERADAVPTTTIPHS